MRGMLVIVLGAMAVAGATALGTRICFERRIAREIDALLADARPPSRQNITDLDVEHLPDPVQRWLRHSQVIWDGTADQGAPAAGWRVSHGRHNHPTRFDR